MEVVEDIHLDFKQSSFWSNGMGREEVESSKSKEVHELGTKASVFLIARATASFMDTEGGQVIVNVAELTDEGMNELRGIEGEFKFLKDRSIDGYKRRTRETVFDNFSGQPWLIRYMIS